MFACETSVLARRLTSVLAIRLPLQSVPARHQGRFCYLCFSLEYRYGLRVQPICSEEQETDS